MVMGLSHLHAFGDMTLKYEQLPLGSSGVLFLCRMAKFPLVLHCVLTGVGLLLISTSSSIAREGTKTDLS